MQTRLLRDVYTEAGVDPSQVTYVEMHGTGTKVGDPQEANSIADFFCSTARQVPLLIGSIKSNMGHAEAASGLASLAKVIVAVQDRAIPANLHFNVPNPEIPALTDGRLKVITERTSWNGGYVGIHSLGFGGANAHILLRASATSASTAPIDCPHTVVPRLFTTSSRTKEGVEVTIRQMIENTGNIDMQALLQDAVGSLPTSTHPFRGSVILNAKITDQLNVEKVDAGGEAGRRPICFIFSGMGSQWSGMGRDLMSVDAFRQSIMQSHAVLSQFNISLYDMIMDCSEMTFRDILSSFVGIVAIQVSL